MVVVLLVWDYHALQIYNVALQIHPPGVLKVYAIVLLKPTQLVDVQQEIEGVSPVPFR